MNFLTSGCSFTGTEATNSGWPVWLQAHGTVKNLGMPGAGNEYIAESIMYELLNNKNKYDCVLVMWSGLQRIDLRVDPLFSDNTLQSFVDIDYFPIGDMIVKSGFEKIASVGNEITRAYKSLMEMIKLQSFLADKDIPCYFMSYVNYWNHSEFLINRNFGIYRNPLLSKLAENLNFDRFIFGPDNECLYEVAKSKEGGLAEDKFHPSGLGTDFWMMDHVIPRLRIDGII